MKQQHFVKKAVALTLALGASAASAHSPTAVEMFADAVIVRPLMLGATALGTGIFLGTLPLSIITGNTDQAAQRLVVEPGNRLVKPCFGCLPSVD